jgi:hypothetical protein
VIDLEVFKLLCTLNGNVRVVYFHRGLDHTDGVTNAMGWLVQGLSQVLGPLRQNMLLMLIDWMWHREWVLERWPSLLDLMGLNWEGVS